MVSRQIQLLGLQDVCVKQYFGEFEKRDLFFFLRCFGRSCWSFMVYMNHDSKIHGTIPALHPGLGKCIRPWKAP